MISEYIKAAMAAARYEMLSDGEGFFAEVPQLAGVNGSGETLELCREDLMHAIEGWIVVKLRHNDSDFPVLGGVDLNPHAVEQEVA